jgi:hypothetical protein
MVPSLSVVDPILNALQTLRVERISQSGYNFSGFC